LGDGRPENAVWLPPDTAGGNYMLRVATMAALIFAASVETTFAMEATQ
jgi:hypothetical protein